MIHLIGFCMESGRCRSIREAGAGDQPRVRARSREASALCDGGCRLSKTRVKMGGVKFTWKFCFCFIAQMEVCVSSQLFHAAFLFSRLQLPLCSSFRTPPCRLKIPGSQDRGCSPAEAWSRRKLLQTCIWINVHGLVHVCVSHVRPSSMIRSCRTDLDSPQGKTRCETPLGGAALTLQQWNQQDMLERVPHETCTGGDGVVVVVVSPH